MTAYQSYLRLSEGTDDLAPSGPSARRTAATLLTALLVLLAVPLFLAASAFAHDDGPSSTHAVREDNSGPGNAEDDDDDDRDDTTTGTVTTTREGNTRGQRFTNEGNTDHGDTTVRTREGNTRGTKLTRDEGPGDSTRGDSQTRTGTGRG